MTPRLPALSALPLLAAIGCAASAPEPAAPQPQVAEVDLRAPSAAPAKPAPSAQARPAQSPGEKQAAAEPEASALPDPGLSPEEKQALVEKAQRTGIIGILQPQPGQASPFGADSALGTDEGVVMGGLIGDSASDSFGVGGLGLRATGLGGGGTGEGTIGLGSVGAIGHGTPTGSGYGVGAGRAASGGLRSSPVKDSDASVNGALPKEVIRRIVRQHINRVRYCYEKGVQRDPALEGKVVVHFVISAKGAVTSAADKGSSLKDKEVVSCVLSTFKSMQFPAPENGGVVSVTYPLMFKPAADAAPAAAPAPAPTPAAAPAPTPASARPAPKP